MGYNPDSVAAPNPRTNWRWHSTITARSAVLTVISRQPRLLEHMCGKPAHCTTSDRSLGLARRNVPGQV